ncbi:MAG: 3-dehydroquinate synthase family protein [Actinomycetes bacterium]
MIHLELTFPDGRSCPVVIGGGASSELHRRIPERAQRVAVVTQSEIPGELDTGRDTRVFVIGSGEKHKTMATIESLCSQFAAWGLTRNDCVVGFGGGMVTDVAGFAASVYHRGVDVVHVATSLLAQIDAAIGGKTGVNLGEGKNLVGTYWQPAAVICDLDFLKTLTEREWHCGLGELAKYHWLGGGDLDALPLEERIAACVQIKAQIVAADERESGQRALLNYGHTLAHALEVAGNHQLRHGEAVAIGLIYAAEVAWRLGRIDSERVAEHLRVVSGYGLPTQLPSGLDSEELMLLMRRDKKVLDSGYTLVLLGESGVEIVAGVDPALMREALESMKQLQ